MFLLVRLDGMNFTHRFPYTDAKTFTDSAVPVARVLKAWQHYPCPQNVSACNPNGFCNDQWTAPAQVKPVFEKFFSQKYSEQGLYVPPELRNSPVGETCSDSKNCPEGCNELGYRPPEGIGCNIAGVLAIFTYGFPVAIENFANANISLKTLSNYSVLLEEAARTGYVNQEEYELLKDWKNDPLVWSQNNQ